MPKKTIKKPLRPKRPVKRTSRRVVLRTRPGSEKGKAKALTIVHAALDKKAITPVVLDIRQLSSYADYLVVMSGNSERHVRAIAQSIKDALRKEHQLALGSEPGAQWTLLDFGDVVVHIFDEPARDFYRLESFWIDAPRIPLSKSVLSHPRIAL